MPKKVAKQATKPIKSKASKQIANANIDPLETQIKQQFKRRKSDGNNAFYFYSPTSPVFGESLLATKATERLPTDLDTMPANLEDIIEPPEIPETLIKLPKRSSILKQCIESMVANIESPGNRFEYDNKDISIKEGPESQEEFDKVSKFCAAPNPFDSLTEIRERWRQDLETLGYAFLEAVRNMKDEVAAIYNVRSHKYKLMRIDISPTKIDYMVEDPGGGKPNKVTVEKYFRRYVYVSSNRLEVIYYKEFGDPRILDAATGEYVSGGTIAFEKQATELIHTGLYDPDNLYGSPRYINNIPALLGSRECELTNFQFFKENAVPNMAVLLSGGFLTEDSVSNLQRFLTSVKGRESMQRIIVLEATGDDAAGSDDGKVAAPKMNIQMLGSERQNDEQFQDYDKNNRSKIQSSFRIPDILLGFSTDYSRNTSDSAKATAESQVFMPERNRTENLFNRKILPAVVSSKRLGNLKFWKFRANLPKLASQEGLTELFTSLGTVGGISTNTAIQLTNEILGLKIPQSDKPWADLPFPIVQALANANNLKGVEDVMINPNGNPPDINKSPGTDITTGKPNGL